MPKRKDIDVPESTSDTSKTETGKAKRKGKKVSAPDSGDEVDVPKASSRTTKKPRVDVPVSSDEAEASGDDDVPVSKGKGKDKPKAASKSAAADADTAGSIRTDGEGNEFVDLGKKKRASVSSFKGATFVNIREYYGTSEDDMKPGKKGIALSKEQWEALKANMHAIDASLRKASKA